MEGYSTLAFCCIWETIHLIGFSPSLSLLVNINPHRWWTMVISATSCTEEFLMKWEFKGFTQSTRISSTFSHNAQIISTAVGYKCMIVALLLEETGLVLRRCLLPSACSSCPTQYEGAKSSVKDTQWLRLDLALNWPYSTLWTLPNLCLAFVDMPLDLWPPF